MINLGSIYLQFCQEVINRICNVTWNVYTISLVKDVPSESSNLKEVCYSKLNVNYTFLEVIFRNFFFLKKSQTKNLKKKQRKKYKEVKRSWLYFVIERKLYRDFKLYHSIFTKWSLWRLKKKITRITEIFLWIFEFKILTKFQK